MRQEIIELLEDELGISRYYVNATQQDKGYLWDITRTVTIETRGEQPVNVKVTVVSREKTGQQDLRWLITKDGKTEAGEGFGTLKIAAKNIDTTPTKM